MPTERALLTVSRFGVDYGATPILADIDLTLYAGEVLAVVGASGSGKSALLRALVGLSGPDARVRGEVRLLNAATQPAALFDYAAHRGRTVGFVPQDPLTSLSAHRTVWQHLEEVPALRGTTRRSQRRERACELLAAVGLESALLDRYPHALSGGQGQRALVALALAGQPAVLLADEPTSALDPLATRSMCDLWVAQARRHDRGVLVVSHDLGAMARVADRVAVLAGGRLVEVGATAAVLQRPQHPLTQALVASRPPLHPPRPQRLAVAPRPSPCERAPSACAFAVSCPRAETRCVEAAPHVRQIAGRGVACHVAAGEG
jgi:oligopeptide/dipeptide ABC transporter ATP-binding protein